jgi:erythromycin esterase-like protein
MPPGRRWSWWSGTALALVAALGPGCRSYERPTELLAAQALYFATPTAPDGVPDRVVAAIAGADVLLLGEEHHVQEHHDFVAVLLPRLHERGFRRVLCEANHAYGWLLDEYVKGARDTLAEKQWNLGRDWIEAIRALNAGLRAGGRAGEQISVGCCDVNHWDDSYRESLAALAERYRSQPLAALVAQLPATADTAYLPAVAAIADAAAGDPARLGLDAAGAAVVTATTRVELASAGYRTSRSDAAREEVLHQNVTAAIDRLAPGGKLAVVCGMSHAQLRPAWRMHSGRAWEWLGTRLAARYAATPGKLYSLACFARAAQTQLPQQGTVRRGRAIVGVVGRPLPRARHGRGGAHRLPRPDRHRSRRRGEDMVRPRQRDAAGRAVLRPADVPAQFGGAGVGLVRRQRRSLGTARVAARGARRYPSSAALSLRVQP